MFPSQLADFRDKACDLPLHLTPRRSVHAVCSLLLRRLCCERAQAPGAFAGGGLVAFHAIHVVCHFLLRKW